MKKRLKTALIVLVLLYFGIIGMVRGELEPEVGVVIAKLRIENINGIKFLYIKIKNNTDREIKLVNVSMDGEFVDGGMFFDQILTRTYIEIYHRTENQPGLKPGETFEYKFGLGSEEMIDSNLGGLKRLYVEVTHWSD